MTGEERIREVVWRVLEHLKASCNSIGLGLVINRARTKVGSGPIALRTALTKAWSLPRRRRSAPSL